MNNTAATFGPTAAKAIAALETAGYQLTYQTTYNRTIVGFSYEGSQYFGALYVGRTGRLVRVGVCRQMVRRGPVTHEQMFEGAREGMAAVRQVVRCTQPMAEAA